MKSFAGAEEPPERNARPAHGRAPRQPDEAGQLGHLVVRQTLEGWRDSIRDIGRRQLTRLTRARLEDCRRISDELAQVLAGREEGEGTASERWLRVASGSGRVQAVSSMFACPRGIFVELLVTAPWNLLDRDDPRDLRTVRGAGTALIADAVGWSRACGCGGRVSLQAENTRTLGFYEHIGFRLMQPSDEPLSLVPSGEAGWSAPVLRLAAGKPRPADRQSPWLVLDPGRAALRPSGRIEITYSPPESLVDGAPAAAAPVP